MLVVMRLIPLDYFLKTKSHLLGVRYPATLNTSQVVACVTNGDYAAKAFVVLGTYFHNDILQVKNRQKNYIRCPAELFIRILWMTEYA